MDFILCLAGFISLATLGYKKPVWGLSAILALLPTYLVRSQFSGIPITLLECMILGFALGLILTKPDWRTIKNLGWINLAIGLFILSAIIATIISPEKLKALGQLKAFFIEPAIFFYAVILTLNQNGEIKSVLRSLQVSSGIISAFGIIQYFTFLWLPIRFWGTGIEATRVTSVFEYPNALALFLAPLFIFFFVLFQKRFTLFEYKWAYHWYFAVSGLALIMTLSRGAWIGILVALALLMLKNKRHLGLITGVVGIILLTLILIPVSRERVFSSFSDSSSKEHLQLIIVGTNRILGAPLLGNGLSGFESTLANSDFQGRLVSYPHNIFLNFWVEIGLLGLLSFAWIIYAALRQYSSQPTVLSQAAGAFLFVLIIHGLVDVPYLKNDLAILFWFAISLFFIKKS